MFQNLLDKAFEVKEKVEGYYYWLAKLFILIGDNYTSLEDFYQAKATYESILENYKGDKELLDEARTKLQHAKDEELKKSNELLLIPEIYLLYSYLNSQKVKIFWTDNDYYNILKNYIYIIDKINLDIFWNKYSNIINKEIFTKSYLEEFDMLDLLIINQKINENN